MTLSLDVIFLVSPFFILLIFEFVVPVYLFSLVCLLCVLCFWFYYSLFIPMYTYFIVLPHSVYPWRLHHYFHFSSSFLPRSFIVLSTLISHRHSNFFSNNLILSSLPLSSSPPYLPTPHSTSDTFYLASLPLIQLIAVFLHLPHITTT